MLGPRLSSGQIIHWPLTEGSGTTITEKVTGTALTMPSGITWNTTYEPTIFCSNATAGFLSQSALLNITKFTCMGWFYCTSVSGHGPIMNFGDASNRTTVFHTRSGSGLALWNNVAGWFDTGFVLPLNKWVHLTYVISGGDRVKFYINGRYYTSIALGTLSNTPGTMCLGTSGVAEYFYGRMKDIRVYNRLLTDGEVFRSCHARTATSNF